MKYQYDIFVTRGETYDNDIIFDADSFDLSGKTAQSQIRPTKENDTLSAQFNCMVNVETKSVHLGLTSRQTAMLAPGTYEYDVFLVGVGFRKCYIGGKFIVDGRSTVVEEELISISGVKTWDDDEDSENLRPASIVIRLLADGVEIANKTVTEDDGWAWTFEGLPKYSDTAEIVYTITEDAIEGYTAIVTGYNVRNYHEVYTEPEEETEGDGE